MIVEGNLKVIYETEDIGTSGFQKRECVVTTDEQYSQDILIQFTQDKCNLLTSFRVGEKVKVDINLRGKECISPNGETKYFNTIQGWRISSVHNPNGNNSASDGHATAPAQTQTNPQNMGAPLPGENDDDGDLPF
jgi:hypothetical protein